MITAVTTAFPQVLGPLHTGSIILEETNGVSGRSKDLCKVTWSVCSRTGPQPRTYRVDALCSKPLPSEVAVSTACILGVFILFTPQNKPQKRKMGTGVLGLLRETSGLWEQSLNSVPLGRREQSSPVCPAQNIAGPWLCLWRCLAGAGQESSWCRKGTSWPSQEG